MATRKKAEKAEGPKPVNGEATTIRAATLADLVAQKPRQLDVKIADGTTVRLYIRQLTAREMISFNERPAEQKDNESALVWLVSKAVVDESGTPILPEVSAGDLTTRPFMQIVPVVLELNPITADAAGGVEGNA